MITRQHDLVAPNCIDPHAWRHRRDFAHCPLCCPRPDHVRVESGRVVRGVAIMRYVHADETETESPGTATPTPDGGTE